MGSLIRAAVWAILLALMAWGLSALFKAPYDRILLYLIFGSYCMHIALPNHD